MCMCTRRHRNRFATGQGNPAWELMYSIEKNKKVVGLFKDELGGKLITSLWDFVPRCTVTLVRKAEKEQRG